MNKMLKKIAVLFLVTVMALTSVGCYGSFTLTKKVYNWNGSLGNKWVTEAVFLACYIVPVYGFAGFVDAVILNSLEFWTGSNPMASTLTSEDGTTVAFNTEKKQVEINYAGKSFVLAVENGKSVVKSVDGTVLASAVLNADGSMTILDAQGNVLNTVPSSEVNAMLAAN